MIKVAVRDDDQIQGDATQRLQIRRGDATDPFGVQSTINQDIKIAELDEQRVGTDAAVAVQVSKLHERSERTNLARENENENHSRGICISNGGNMT
jgi:hypothetical protein